MAKKLPWLKGRRKDEDLLESLCHAPRHDPEHKKMRAWYKREKELFGRDYDNNPYAAWLIEEYGPGAIADADEAWLTSTVVA